MKVDLFTPVVYYGDLSKRHGSPFIPRLFEPEVGVRSIDWGLEELAAGHRAGFDRLTLAEHHYSPAQMTPAPHQFAAIAGQALPDAEFAILGTDLPLHNPINVAEQYALLDNILKGRLSFALLRGTPNEYMTYGTNPWESRPRFEEAVELVLRALTEPEPFGWEGRYYRFRNVAVFPGTVQQPYPPLTLSGNSIGSAKFAARIKANLGISFLPAEGAAACVAAYYEAAEEAGWTPTPDNILYRQFAWIAESDAEAEKQVSDIGWPGIMGMNNPAIYPVMGAAGAAMAGVPKGVVPDMSKAPALFAEPWIGSADTVLAGIHEVAQQVGFGRVELNFTGFGSASHESVLGTIEYAGEALLPSLHAAELAAV